jgi:hypothetical protein
MVGLENRSRYCDYENGRAGVRRARRDSSPPSVTLPDVGRVERAQNVQQRALARPLGPMIAAFCPANSSSEQIAQDDQWFARVDTIW